MVMPALFLNIVLGVQGLLVWLCVVFPAMLFGSYTIWPVAGGGPLVENGGPNIVVLCLSHDWLASQRMLYQAATPLLGKYHPIALLSAASRQSDEEAYYMSSQMPFHPKKILEYQIECDRVSKLGKYVDNTSQTAWK